MATIRILRGEKASLVAPAWGPAQQTQDEPERGSEAVTVARAEEDLEHRLKQMEATIGAVREEAYRKGFAEGEAKGRKAEAKFESLNRALAETIAQLSSYKAELRASAERDMLELSIAIARRVLRREINVDPHALEGIVAACLDRINAQELTAVRVHPFHAEALREQMGRLCPGANVNIEADATLAMGSVIFETVRGAFDGSVDSQLEEVERGLADRLEKRR